MRLVAAAGMAPCILTVGHWVPGSPRLLRLPHQTSLCSSPPPSLSFPPDPQTLSVTLFAGVTKDVEEAGYQDLGVGPT